jgi:spore coat polysaccharide biosynthesis protein SpsF
MHDTTYKTVSIIIQARSTSTRFPGKIFAKIGPKQVLQHVLDACYNSSAYINKYTNKHGIVCGVAIAVPENDPLIPHYRTHKIFQGPEDDVLGRYVQAADKMRSDYIVRITSDCPFVPPYIISKAINIAVSDHVDFLTNADPIHRTTPDGHDVQVMSARMLKWLDENSKTPAQREHVTTLLLEREPPADFVQAQIVGFADYSAIKLSVDTPEDLKRITEMYEKIYQSVNSSRKCYRL